MKFWLKLAGFVLIAGSIAGIVFFYFQKNTTYHLVSPIKEISLQTSEKKDLPLNKYTILNLKNYPYQASQIKLVKELDNYSTDEFRSYLFTYQTMAKTMSGVINLPFKVKTGDDNKPKVIIMIRGWVPRTSYKPGIGTQPAASVFAKHGYITLSPDFFGYGQSDPEPDDSWEARFIKPINVIELIKTIQDSGVPTKVVDPSLPSSISYLPSRSLGIWAHSNGGQIALTTLEILSQPIPTTLWAPVTAPFPYSILFFTDEMEDEGKATRKWLSMFEKDYNVFDFSLTKHLDFLTGPLQIHHGTADEAALKTWSDEFVAKLEKENKRREAVLATASAQVKSEVEKIGGYTDKTSSVFYPLSSISYTYYTYPGADHNLRPMVNWNQAVNRDLKFFEKEM